MVMVLVATGQVGMAAPALRVFVYPLHNTDAAKKLESAKHGCTSDARRIPLHSL
jgi:hypothetical protein